MPTSITWGNGNKQYIVYDASGSKLRETFQSAGGGGTHTRTYLGGFEYFDSKLEAVDQPEGRIVPGDGDQFYYEYALKDHLGNTRVTFSDRDGDGFIRPDREILQESHYYPFGMEMTGPWQDVPRQYPSDTRYLFNGKEQHKDFGLQWYDYGARWYDPAVGRWWSVDPLAEWYHTYTPYGYVLNNPVLLLDPDGMSLEDTTIVLNEIVVTAPRPEVQKSNYTPPALKTCCGDKLDIFIDNQIEAKHPGTIDYQSYSNSYHSIIYPAGSALLGFIGGEMLGGSKVYSWITKLFSKSMPAEVAAVEAEGAVEISTKGGSEAAGEGVGVVEDAGVGSEGAEGGFKTLSELGLKDGMKVPSSRALELGEQFLGKGYKELVPGSGRYVSADGTRVFRMGERDITGAHGGGPHVNFETLIPNPAKAGKKMVDQNFHIYLTN